MTDIIHQDDPHARFLPWARERGIVSRGVRPMSIGHGRGIGIVAEQSIKVGEEVVNVPNTALFTSDCVPQSFKDAHKCSTVHGLLTSFLACAATDQLVEWTPWMDTWPTLQDFKLSMPLLWSSLRDTISNETETNMKRADILPSNINTHLYTRTQLSNKETWSLLKHQETKLRLDFEMSCKATSICKKDPFVHKWLVVNTRSFYYDLPLALEPSSNEDKMVLCPFIDYFNHKDKGCKVSYDDHGFTVIADRDYEAGDELSVCYGQHSTDMLLVEYGFVPDSNIFDHLSLDHLVLQPDNGIHVGWQRRLQRAGYLGNYCADADGVCHRTRVAARTQTLPLREWGRFVAGNLRNDQKEKTGDFINRHYLQPYIEECEEAKRLVGALQTTLRIDDQGPLRTLQKRWDQKIQLLRAASIAVVADSHA